MKRIIASALLLMLLVTATTARAEVMVPMGLGSLTARAQLVVRGQVLDRTVERDPEGRIFTRIDLGVDEVWKGLLATNRFSIVHGGGTLGNERMVVSGQAEYEVGEEVVAFLVINARGEGVSVGLSQGKFHLWNDPVSGEKLAQNRFHGLASQSEPAAKPPIQPLAIHSRLTVDQLKQSVVGGSH